MGVVLGPVVFWLCDGRCRLVRSWPPWTPLPLPPAFGFFVFFAPCCVRVHVAGGLPLPRRGCAPACLGCIFLRPFGGCVVVVGPFLCPGVFRLGGVVSRCPISGYRGCRLWCCLAGGLPASLKWVRGFAVV